MMGQHPAIASEHAVSLPHIHAAKSTNIRAVERTWYGAYIIHYSRPATYAFAHNTEIGFLVGGRWWPVGVGLSFFSWHVSRIYDAGQCLVTHVFPGNPWLTWVWGESC